MAKSSLCSDITEEKPGPHCPSSSRTPPGQKTFPGGPPKRPSQPFLQQNSQPISRAKPAANQTMGGAPPEVGTQGEHLPQTRPCSSCFRARVGIGPAPGRALPGKVLGASPFAPNRPLTIPSMELPIDRPCSHLGGAGQAPHPGISAPSAIWPISAPLPTPCCLPSPDHSPSGAAGA